MNDRNTMNGKPVFTMPASTVINFKSHFDKKMLCTGLTFTAGQACNYSCSFCYVESMQRKQMDWFKAKGVEYPPEGHAGVVIRTENAVEIARQQIMSKPEAFRQSHQVIYASPKVDVAGNMELVLETVEICKIILCHTNWIIRLLSKSNLLPVVARALEHIFEESGIAKKRIIYGVSTGTLNNKLAAAFEQGTAKVSKRIESLHWLQNNGYRTFAMICPSLPMLNFDEYDTMAQGMRDALRYDRCEHVWAEVINVRGDSFVNTHKALHSAGFLNHAAMLNLVSQQKNEWEKYARQTFMAHIFAVPPGKLRFLQYVTNDTREWWGSHVQNGAVLL